MKNVIIAGLLTWIFFREFAVEIPSPWFIIPAGFLICLAVIMEIEELIRKEWFY